MFFGRMFHSMAHPEDKTYKVNGGKCECRMLRLT